MEHPLNVPFLDFDRVNTVRTKCFFWRFRLGHRPLMESTVKLLIGLFINLHAVATLLILTVRIKQFSDRYDKYELSLVPLMALAVEIFALSSIILGIVCSDLAKYRLILSVWHRNALGRLVRNLFIAFLCLLACILYFVYIKSRFYRTIVVSMTYIALPLIVLLGFTALKVILIEGKHVLYWLLLIFAALVQMGLLIWKFDYDSPTEWWVILSPCFVLIPLLLYRIGYSLLKSIHRRELSWVLYKLIGTVGVMLLYPSFILFIDSIEDPDFPQYYWAMIWACMICLTLGFSKNTGNLVYDMLLGHVETDYYHFVKPTTKQVQERSYSDSILAIRRGE